MSNEYDLFKTEKNIVLLLLQREGNVFDASYFCFFFLCVCLELLTRGFRIPGHIQNAKNTRWVNNVGKTFFFSFDLFEKRFL